MFRCGNIKCNKEVGTVYDAIVRNQKVILCEKCAIKEGIID